MALLARNLLEEASISTSLAVLCIDEGTDVWLPDIELRPLGCFLESLQKGDEWELEANSFELVEAPMEEIQLFYCLVVKAHV